jgi:ParB-like nuclease domain
MPVSFKKNPKISIHTAIDDVVGTSEHQWHVRSKSDPRIEAERVEHVPIDQLMPNSKNAKLHPERRLALLEANIEEFGFQNPLLVDENDRILVGHARWEAARRLGFTHLPVVRLTHLSPAQKRAAADITLAELGAWDYDILAKEFEFLTDRNSDITFDYGRYRSNPP